MLPPTPLNRIYTVSVEPRKDRGVLIFHILHELTKAKVVSVELSIQESYMLRDIINQCIIESIPNV